MSNPSPSLKAILAENLRLFRKTQGYSQEELASRCELHRTYIGSMNYSNQVAERLDGVVHNENLAAISMGFSVRINHLDVDPCTPKLPRS